jgi:hypothetical protein
LRLRLFPVARLVEFLAHALDSFSPRTQDYIENFRRPFAIYIFGSEMVFGENQFIDFAVADDGTVLIVFITVVSCGKKG